MQVAGLLPDESRGMHKLYNRIVFVAESGDCREPMAAAILKDVGLKQPAEVLARGLVVLFPEPMNQKAEAVMISNGLPVEGYMSSPLTKGDLEGDTLVLAMEEKQRQKILEMFEDADPAHVHVLTEFVGDELEIVNPYGGTLQMYGLCYETLLSSVRKLAHILSEGRTEDVKNDSYGSSADPA